MFLKAEEIISGQEGRAYLKVNGRNRELMYLKSVEAVVTKKKTAVRTLGRSGDQYKAAGWSGRGKMSVYYVTSLFRELMIQYIRTGNSSFGRQTVALRNCNLNSVVLAKLDVNADNLDETVEFTFDGAELLDSFA